MMESRIESYTKTSKLAQLALIISLPCVIAGPFALIPLLLAIFALTRIFRSPELEGKPIAITAMVLSVVGLLSTKLYLDAAENAKFLSSKTVARSLSYAVILHMDSHDDEKPGQNNWADVLVDEGFIEPALLFSPREDGDGISYFYLADFTPGDERSIMLFEDPSHWDQGVIVAFGDAHVEVLSHAEFQSRLAEQTAKTSP